MGNKREKNPTFTYIKEFDNFSSGYEELIKIIPQLEVYGGIVPAYDNVVMHMTKVINENIPSPYNELYPNTLSFSISAKEVGFLTDDSLAFGWKIFINHKDGSMSYQFRVTFISLSMSKRKYIEKLISNKWKARDLVEKQSRFWHEAANSQRAAIKDGSSYRRVPNHVSETIPVHNDVLAEDGRDKYQTRNDSHADQQTSSGEVSRPVAKLETREAEKEEAAKPTIVQRVPPIKEEDPKLVYVDETTIKPITREEILESAVTEEKPIIAPKPEEEEPKPISKPVKVKAKKLDKPTQTVTMTSGEDEKNIERNRMMMKASCSITRGETDAQFNVTHKGVTKYININDRNPDIILNRACHTFMIENVVYNYETCQVTVLDEAYQPESATNLGCRSSHVNVNLPDTAFVGEKAKNKFLEDRGLAPSSGIIIAGQKGPRKKKNLVIDKTPKVEPTGKIQVRPGEQMIRMDNVGGPNL